MLERTPELKAELNAELKTELETCIAFQDDTIATLNDIVTRQQLELDRIQRRVSNLESQLKAILPTLIASQNEETPPPHY